MRAILSLDDQTRSKIIDFDYLKIKFVFSFQKVDTENHYVFSVFGILNIRQNGLDVEFYELAEWYRHAKLWYASRQIPFFRDYLIKKQFNL